jgi:hypothetical protein
MTKLMLSLAAIVAFTSSAQAQCFPYNGCGREEEYGNSTPVFEVAKCGKIEIRWNSDGKLELWQTDSTPSSVFRVASLLHLGKDLLESGIDVQTNEPARYVTIETAIDKKTNEKTPGKFEVAIHDFTFEYGADGNPVQIPTRWSNDGYQCNDAANELLSQSLAQAVAQAKPAKEDASNTSPHLVGEN